METLHWIQYFTDKDDYGREIPYYFNKETKEVQWEQPDEMKYVKYGALNKNTHDLQKRFPESVSSIYAWFQDIGVTSISSLKEDSIRRLYSFHNDTQHTIDWSSLARDNNGLLLYIICSQFYNPHSCFDEINACISELLLFLPTVDETLAVLLDSHFGGATQCVKCLSYLLFSCNEGNCYDVDSICSFYLFISAYLPFDNDLLSQFQFSLSLHMNQLVVKCMVFLSQNNIPQFVSSIVAPGSVSSSILTLLNETSLEDDFASILWQFVQRTLKIDNHVLYCSDEMVLIDILLRRLHDLPHTHLLYSLFHTLLYDIQRSERWRNEMNQYKREEIQEFF